MRQKHTKQCKKVNTLRIVQRRHKILVHKHGKTHVLGQRGPHRLFMISIVYHSPAIKQINSVVIVIQLPLFIRRIHRQSDAPVVVLWAHRKRVSATVHTDIHMCAWLLKVHNRPATERMHNIPIQHPPYIDTFRNRRHGSRNSQRRFLRHIKIRLPLVRVILLLLRAAHTLRLCRIKGTNVMHPLALSYHLQTFLSIILTLLYASVYNSGAIYMQLSLIKESAK